MASLSMGMRIALAMKPGESLDCVTSACQFEPRVSRSNVDSPFLQALPNARALSNVSVDVCKAGMISTNFLRC